MTSLLDIPYSASQCIQSAPSETNHPAAIQISTSHPATITSHSATIPNNFKSRQNEVRNTETQHNRYPPPSNQKNVLIIHSSRGNRLIPQALLGGDPVSKKKASTIHQAKQTILQESSDASANGYSDIVLLTGSNDLSNSYNSHGDNIGHVVEKLKHLISTTKSSFPTAKVHFCTIFHRLDVPNEMILNTNNEMRDFCEISNVNIIDLENRLTQEDLYDGLHTNNKGTAKVARAITANLRSPTSPHQPHSPHYAPNRLNPHSQTTVSHRNYNQTPTIRNSLQSENQNFIDLTPLHTQSPWRQIPVVQNMVQHPSFNSCDCGTQNRFWPLSQ